MPKLLVAVDGSENAQHAVRYVVKLAPELTRLDVCILNVRDPPVVYGEVSRYLPKEKTEKWTREVGKKLVATAEALFHEASFPCISEVLIGEVAPTIVRRAKELGCDAIVMGSRGMTSLKNLVLGSIASRVVHLSDIPVVLVKASALNQHARTAGAALLIDD